MFWLDAPGPVRASLLFRVGTADETLPRRGLTHLVEHLALAPFEGAAYWCNGWVEESRTTFYAEGSMADVRDFLARLGRSLREPTLDRLEAECSLLRTEGALRSTSVHDRLMSMRFGAAGFGAGSYEELGLRAVSAETAAEWARAAFGAGNAALWMTARPPDDLELELGPDERLPTPVPQTTPGVRMPAQRGAGYEDVALAFLGRRSAALATAGVIARERAEARLRVRDGLSYDVESDYHPLDAGSVHLRLSADCTDAHAIAVRDELQRGVDELAESGPTAAELERRVELNGRGLDDTDWPRRVLDWAAADHLYGLPLDQPEDDLDALRALTPAAVAEAIAAVLSSELVVVPESVAAARGRFAEHGHEPRPPVTGREFRPRRSGLRRGKWRFVLGDEGLSLVDPDGEPATVRFEDCAALIDDEPGAFSFKARDGTNLYVTTYLLEGGDELRDALRERVPAELHVPFEPAVAELARLADGLPELSRVGGELEALPGLLAPGERPLALAEARRRRRRTGTLLATDRRLVWMYAAGGDDDTVELPWQAVKSVRVKGSRVTIEGGGETLELSRARPRAALAGIERAFTTLSEV